MADAGALLREGKDLLIREAAFLDEQRWDDWLALYLPECEYWVPTWIDEDTLATDPGRQLSHVYYDNRAGLEDRVARVRTGKSPASSPLRRTTHMVGNVLVLEGDAAAMALRSSWTCHIYDPHRQRTDLLFGHSSYRLAATPSGWRIAKRKTVVQKDLLPAMVDFYCL